MKNYFILLFTMTLWCITSNAQIQQDPTRWKHEVKHVKDNIYEVVTTCTFADKEWHLYSFNPGGDGTLIAPELTYKFTNGAKKKGRVTEHGKVEHSTIPDVGTINFIKNKIVYRQQFTADKDGKVTGTVYYQTCNEETCLPPKEISFSVNYKVVKDQTAGDASDADTSTVSDTDIDSSSMIDSSEADSASAAVPAASGGDGTEGTGKEEKKKESNVLLFFEGILAGLLSIVTPCVFAMLPMVVSLFLKRSKTRQEGIKVASQYTLSIVAIFALFGLILTLFVKDGDFLHKFSTNWVVNVFLFLLFFIFALSFLGAFEISLPSSWSTATDKKANTNNFTGVFFMALTLVIVSFSCTLPFLGGLATAITKGTGWAPFWGFTGFGVGLGLPFTLFVLFPGWLTAINKQGGWLNTLKVTLGFIELALAFKFLSNADLVKGWRLLDREIFIAIWFVIALVCGLYLLGMFKTPKDSELPKNAWGLPYISVPRLLFALTALIFGTYLFPGMWGAPLKGMGAFIPPFGTFDAFGAVAPANSAYGEGTHSDRKYAEKLVMYEPDAVGKYKLEVYFDYEEALEASRNENKPIMLDFTGIACANCRKLESSVWSDPEVGKLLHDHFIIASLFTDAYNEKLLPEDVYTSSDGKQIDNLGEKNVNIQIEKYQSNTQPYYFFIDADENRLVQEGYGYSIPNSKPANFANVLKEAISNYNKKE